MKDASKLPANFMDDFTRAWTEVRFCAKMLSIDKAYIAKGERNGKMFRYTRIKNGYNYAELDAGNR